jgi:phospholipid/cholesterol/gamma-HCH transport system substrate-binding protein
MAAVKPRPQAPAAPTPPGPVGAHPRRGGRMPPSRGRPGRGRQVVAGAAVVLALLAGTVFAVAAPRLLARPDHSFQIRFTSADGLVAGSDVLEAGAKIGTISDIAPTQDDHALVSVVIGDDHWPLHQGLSADIRPKSLLGEKYVDIHDGTQTAVWTAAGPLQTDITAVPVELDQFVNSLDPNTRAAARILLSDLGAGVAGRGADLNAAIAASKQDLAHLATFGTTLNNRDADLDRILVGLEGVLGTITQADQLTQMSQLISNGQQTLNAIETQQAAFSRSFVDAQQTLTELNVGLDSAVPSLRSTLAVAPDLFANLTTEGRMLASLGSEVNNNTVLPALIAGIQHGPTATGGALERSPNGILPIFRICLLNIPASCQGGGSFQPPGGNGVPAANFNDGADSAMLASMMGA